MAKKRRSASARKPPAKRKAATKRKRSAKRSPSRGRTKLLSGGNPQIAKGDGDAPVQAYIAAMPGWKSTVGKRLDELVERNVPGLRKAVKWNSPFYGTDENGWFLSFHVFTRYVKVTFFRGAALKPPPPGPSKDPNTRYLDIYEDDALDEAELVSWIEQAASMAGWMLGR